MQAQGQVEAAAAAGDADDGGIARLDLGGQAGQFLRVGDRRFFKFNDDVARLDPAFSGRRTRLDRFHDDASLGVRFGRFFLA